MKRSTALPINAPSPHTIEFLKEALAIDVEEAKKNGTLGYMARALALATLPHRETACSEFTRTNGAFTLSIYNRHSIGLPYGTIPRLLTAWVTTEAVKTKQKTLVLGNSLSVFMEKLEMVPTGGRWGTITRLKDQMRRLFTSTISATFEDDKSLVDTGYRFSENYKLLWDPQNPEQAALWNSTLDLSDPFYKEAINFPIPISLEVLKLLRRSPMALDIYFWLTYRMSYLRKDTTIPWEALQLQFGAAYPYTTRGTLDFKRNFLIALRKVLIPYPAAHAEETERGLFLSPSPTHIKMLAR